MPSVSVMHAAFGAMRDHQEKIAGLAISMDRQYREAAARRAERAREAMKALEPLLMAEGEQLAGEAQGYVDRRAA